MARMHHLTCCLYTATHTACNTHCNTQCMTPLQHTGSHAPLYLVFVQPTVETCYIFITLIILHSNSSLESQLSWTRVNFCEQESTFVDESELVWTRANFRGRGRTFVNKSQLLSTCTCCRLCEPMSEKSAFFLPCSNTSSEELFTYHTHTHAHARHTHTHTCIHIHAQTKERRLLALSKHIARRAPFLSIYISLSLTFGRYSGWRVRGE